MKEQKNHDRKNDDRRRRRLHFWSILNIFQKDRDLLLLKFSVFLEKIETFFFFNSRSFWKRSRPSFFQFSIFSEKIENCLYCVFPLFLDLFGKDRGPIFIQFSIFFEKIEEPFLFKSRSFLKRSRTHFFSILDLF